MVRGNRVLVERIMAARPDNRAWCKIEAHRASSVLPAFVTATDPLNLAAAAGRADLLALIAPRFSQGACVTRHNYHHLHQSALRTAIARRDVASVRVLVAHGGAADHDRRAVLAEDLQRAGLGEVAAELYYAGAQRESDHPLARATEQMAPAKRLGGGEPGTRAPRRPRLCLGTEYQQGEPAVGAIRTAVGNSDCTAIIDLYRGHGFAINEDSVLLHRVIQRDRTAGTRRARLEEARRFLAAYRRAGGGLDTVATGHCTPDPRDAHANHCTPGELARARPRAEVELGDTAFAGLLPPDRPLINRLIGNARAAGAERYMEAVRNEARPRGCLISLADPSIRARTRLCLARGGAPLFEK